jgi:hypothetical protein
MSKDNVKCDPSQPAWFSLLSHRWPALLSRASIPVDLTPSGYFPRCDFSNYVLLLYCMILELIVVVIIR